MIAQTNTGKLAGFLAFIKNEILDEVAAESIRVSREINFPLMQLFAHLPDAELIGLSKKSITEFADSVADGSFIEKQLTSLKNWEEDKIGDGLRKDSIQPSDLILAYTARKKAFHRFIPRYTSDAAELVAIVDELEMLYSEVQERAVNMLFQWRIEVENKLASANNFLDTVLENIPNMIFVKDANELRFVRLNHAGEELLGYAKEELTGKNDYDFFPKAEADFFTGKDRDVLAKKKLVDIPEEQISTAQKGVRWLHTKKIPVFDKDGKPVYLLGISEDITEKKVQEDINQQLNKELEAFTYTVSHDLRAPLRAITGYANMLDEDYGKQVDEEGKRLLEVIKYNAEKMGRLIDDLLAFSKLGRKELDRAVENMDELVEGVISELSRSNPNHAHFKIEKLLPARIDYGLIHQVWLNLLANAIKYSSKNKNPEIEIRSEKKGNELIYSVKDNGVGFDMKYYNKLFGVFQRLHSAEEFDGTGVGLAIVQRIVSRHKGRVWAEGETGKGATFYFSLPAD
jgi:PAS domain S-box-containing protein